MSKHLLIMTLAISTLLGCNPPDGHQANETHPTGPITSSPELSAVIKSDSGKAVQQKSNFEKYWDGSSHGYCSIPFLNPLKAIVDKLEDLISLGQFQEAIWILEERRPDEKSEIERLKKELAHLLTEGTYKVLPRQLGGSSKKQLLEFENGTLGLFKASASINPSEYHWVDEKAEVAAYALDQLLDLNLVPMTVIRKIDGEAGSVQYFFNHVANGKLENVLARNFAALKVFDYLTGNTDRKLENLLYWQEENRIIGIDNGAGFKQWECGNPEEIKKYLSLAPQLRNALNEISDRSVENALSPYLAPDIIHLIVKRIHLLKEHSDRHPDSISSRKPIRRSKR